MRPDGEAIRAQAARLALDVGAGTGDWNGFSILHTSMGLPSALEAGCLPGAGGLDAEGMLAAAEKGDVSFVWLLGADELPMHRLQNAFVVYQGTHGDAGAHVADVILPAAAWTEMNATYVNMEGRPQLALRAVFPPGEAREGWRIITQVARALGAADAAFGTAEQLRSAMYEHAPQLAHIDMITLANPAELKALAEGGRPLSDAPLKPAIADFWQSNAVARASDILRRMSAIMRGGQSREAAE